MFDVKQWTIREKYCRTGQECTAAVTTQSPAVLIDGSRAIMAEKSTGSGLTLRRM